MSINSISPPLVIVTPYYEDWEAVKYFFDDLAKHFINADMQIELIVVDDGSIHKPMSLRLLEDSGISGEIIYLKRNLGHQRAIAVGLCYAETHYSSSNVVVMDSDGEDRPESVLTLVKQLNGVGDCDAIVATRKSRVESWRFQFFYFWYKWFFLLATGRSISFGNFMILKPSAVKRLVAMQELWIHLAGTILLSKLRLGICPIDRGSRYAGKSKMNFVALVLHGFKGLMVFAEDVFVRVGIFCAAIAVISLLLMPIPLALKFMGMATPGWASVLIGVFLLIFIQTGTLTLLTLLLTGLTKGGGVPEFSYEIFVAKVLGVSPKRA